MAIDFINTYFPDVADVDEASLLSARQRLDTFLKQKFPNLDTRPNSVFGDLGLSPYAYLVACHEIAMGRFMSDLDLEQVANGVIYNCDFVKKYIQNFATVDQTTLQSSGVIRLVFCNNDSYTIDRRARFIFNTVKNFWGVKNSLKGFVDDLKPFFPENELQLIRHNLLSFLRKKEKFC